MKQIERQLDILRTLQVSRFGKSARELADEFNVSVRTIQRDLRDLDEACFLVNEPRDDQRTYYHLQKDTKLPLNFSSMEVAAMIFAERTGMGLVGTPFGEYLESVSGRLKDAMHPKMQQFLERATEAYVPHLRGYKKSYEAAREVFDNLHEAIQERRVCRVSYRSPWAESARQYNIEPLHFLPHRGGLYVISRMPYYDQLITQAVDRFEAVEVTEKEFEPPDHLSVDERLSNAFGISSEEPMDVVVRFTEEQAPYIRERIWHPSQDLEALEDGQVVLRLRAGGFYEIKSWVLSFGAAAEVLEPEELRAAVREEMRVALGLDDEGAT